MLGLAGMPVCVLGPYARFLEGLSICGAYAEGYGAFEQRKCSIPQGCPFSMVTLALALTPWVRE
eukprot:6476923-Alexandrium_andersonii.AAC.1